MLVEAPLRETRLWAWGRLEEELRVPREAKGLTPGSGVDADVGA